MTDTSSAPTLFGYNENRWEVVGTQAHDHMKLILHQSDSSEGELQAVSTLVDVHNGVYVFTGVQGADSDLRFVTAQLSDARRFPLTEEEITRYIDTTVKLYSTPSAEVLTSYGIDPNDRLHYLTCQSYDHINIAHLSSEYSIDSDDNATPRLLVLSPVAPDAECPDNCRFLERRVAWDIVETPPSRWSEKMSSSRLSVFPSPENQGTWGNHLMFRGDLPSGNYFSFLPLQKRQKDMDPTEVSVVPNDGGL